MCADLTNKKSVNLRALEVLEGGFCYYWPEQGQLFPPVISLCAKLSYWLQPYVEQTKMRAINIGVVPIYGYQPSHLIII